METGTATQVEEEVPVEFKQGSSVYCFSVGSIYHAKILEVSQPLFLVRYQGWGAKWDEWVPRERLLPDNAESEAKKRACDEEAARKRREEKRLRRRQTQDDDSEGSGDSSVISRPSSSNEKKRRREGENGDEEIAKMVLTPILKKRLVQDYESITQRSMLVNLPHKYPVSSILMDFVKSKPRGAAETLLINEIIQGFSAYFNRVAGTLLQYRFERVQADTLLSKSQKVPVDIFGVEHLLRCFVTLPDFLAESGIDDTNRKIIPKRVQELIKFVDRNEHEYFHSEEKASGYVRASAEYMERLKIYES